MAGLAILLSKGKAAKAGKPEEEMKEEMPEAEAEGEEEADGGLEAMKLFESAGSTEEKLKAFKMLMKACEY